MSNYKNKNKRMYQREFVVYPSQGKVVVFNYPTYKGLHNREASTMYVKIFTPSSSSWMRLSELTARHLYPSNMAINENGEIRFSFSAGESLT